MKITTGVKRSHLVFVWVCFAAALGAAACNRTSVAAGTAAADALPSWNDGPAKRAILDFVKATTDRGGARFVPTEDRIATFDQDGTLWVEHPLYSQGDVRARPGARAGAEHPEWKKTEPFKAVLAGDERRWRSSASGTGRRSSPPPTPGMTHRGVPRRRQTVAGDRQDIRASSGRTPSSSTSRCWRSCGYLRANGFRTYIVTGGGQEFVRAYSERVYGVPPEQVVGSSIATKYEVQDGKPVLMREPKMFLIDDHAGKAMAINLFIGKRPIRGVRQLRAATPRCWSGRGRRGRHAADGAGASTTTPSANTPTAPPTACPTPRSARSRRR